MLALFVNAAILIVAAATFHDAGHTDVSEISDAFRLLSPLLGVGIASTLFALALLASLRVGARLHDRRTQVKTSRRGKA
jgi:manganese transport protein